METNKSQYVSIDDYIAKAQPEVREILQTIRTVIKEAAPAAVEKISYQMPTFELHGNLVHFAAFQKHIGLYPAPAGIAAFAGELSKYKGGKGSVQFPLEQPMPYDLIRRIVEYRVAENTRKAESKKRQPRQ